jgi:hypothetical protein
MMVRLSPLISEGNIMQRLKYLAAGALVVATGALAGCDTMSHAWNSTKDVVGLGSTKTVHTAMNAAQETKPNKSNGTGTADLTLDTNSKLLTWNVSYTGLTGAATAAHIHGPAAAGVDAPPVINLAPSGMSNPLQGSVTLTDAQVADLMAGKYYINVHTAQNKGGEIRGQITP